MLRAVRLARIKELNFSLPLVLDDSAVNFDPMHQGRLVEVLMEFVKKQNLQIFILTCHPAIIKTAADHADVGGYWKIDRGRFEGPYSSPEPVISCLGNV